MELATVLTERHEQYLQLQDKAPHSYAKLRVVYQATIEELDAHKQQLVEYKQKAHYWEAQFSQIKNREGALQTELDELKAQLRKREQQLFGRRSEKQTAKQATSENSTTRVSKKKRGQQPGSTGHGRRDYSDLPQVEEDYALPAEEQRCACCGLPLKEMWDTEDSEIVEIINVQAYTRKIRRKKYQRTCHCPETAKIQSAPAPARLLPKSRIGVCVWSQLLLQKYQYQQPLNRALQQLSACGLSIATGTVVDGFQKLLPLLMPIYDAIVARSLSASHWHADETGWKVFEAIEGKAGNHWFLWIFQNKETVVYKLCPSRSSKVLIEHFGTEHDGGTLNVDRYSAYKAIAKKGLFILAFCWAHVRRDFLSHAKGYPHQEAWALEWVERIAKLYHINNKRLEFREKSKSHRQQHQKLERAISQMRKRLDEQLQCKMLLPSAKKLLVSLDNHWGGLTVFVDNPHIPMDNNTAERGLRHAVVGRKNYYGSGSVWSSQLTAVMFTILKTIAQWNINSHTWLLAYLHECAAHGSCAPGNIDKFLPWEMDQKKLTLFAQPPVHENLIDCS